MAGMRPWRRLTDQRVIPPPLLSLPTLTGWLRTHGVEVLPVDANVEAFDTLLRREPLHALAKRVMTVVHTARKQDRNVLGFLTECCVAALEHAQAPSLFALAR